jgi:manganese/iron transport system substrate-binding protein
MKTITRWVFATGAVVSMLLLTTSGCWPGTEATPEHGHDADEMPSLSPATLDAGAKLQVVATTSIVADVVRNVGGDLIDLKTLMPVGADPHAFEPTPQDVAAVADAHVVFVNGAGLEEFLEPLLESAGEGVTVVPASYGVELLQFGGEHEEEAGWGDPSEHHHGGADPHTWFDPHNVMVWAYNVEHALSALDPAHAETYQANAEAYEAELEALDAWIQEQVAQVPEAHRKLVTDHTAFSYFARRYGFEQIGAVFPGYSTLAEPSAQELAALEDAIREHDVQAVFVGVTVNPDLAQRVAGDTGTRLVFLYTGSLSERGGPAGDYFALMRYNVSAITEALR